MNRWQDTVEVMSFESPEQLSLFFEPGTIFRLTVDVCGDGSFADPDEEIELPPVKRVPHV